MEPYRNLGHRARHKFDDSERSRARRASLLGRKAPEDPCCIVECGYCRERVMATKGKYWSQAQDVVSGELVFVPHAHQPQGPKIKTVDEDFVNFKDKKDEP